MNTFTFGKNWKQYLNELSPQQIAIAEKSLKDFFGVSNFRNKTFVDVGCGSGLFSLAAYRMQAKKIISFDIDPDSVDCCKKLRALQNNPKNWEVKRGSILDKRFVKKLGKHNYVYSWGVLHHTGKMWPAIKNCADLVVRDGLWYLAIYNRIDDFSIYKDGRIGSSSFWLKLKRWYAGLSNFGQQLVNQSLSLILIFFYLVRLKNPFKIMREHHQLRGMAWNTDIVDWLGGYPYEYASAAEIFNFVKNLKFSLEKLNCPGGLRNNEYLFKKS